MSAQVGQFVVLLGRLGIGKRRSWERRLFADIWTQVIHFLEVSNVKKGGPANRGDLRVGDYLVKVEDSITFFMSSQDVEHNVVS